MQRKISMIQRRTQSLISKTYIQTKFAKDIRTTKSKDVYIIRVMLRTPHSPKAMQKILQIPGTPVYDPSTAQHQTKGQRIIAEQS